MAAAESARADADAKAHEVASDAPASARTRRPVRLSSPRKDRCSSHCSTPQPIASSRAFGKGRRKRTPGRAGISRPAPRSFTPLEAEAPARCACNGGVVVKGRVLVIGDDLEIVPDHEEVLIIRRFLAARAANDARRQSAQASGSPCDPAPRSHRPGSPTLTELLEECLTLAEIHGQALH